MSNALQRTPLYACHVALGARMVPFAGWEMPVQYVGVTQEHQAVRSAAGLFDVSHMGELYFEGPNATRTLDALVTNDVDKLAVGRALYTVACNEQGTILDDLIIYRLQASRYLVVCNASNLDKMRGHFAERVARQCDFTDRSPETALLALQGPLAVDVMRKVQAPVVVVEAPRFAVVQTTLAGRAVTVARTGYTGEDGYEIFCAGTDATTLWQSLLEAGSSLGVQPIGLAARDTLRLESRLSLYGHEIDETTNPLEAGLGWVVKLDKGDFLGREALLRCKRTPLTRKLVGFEMIGRGIARQGYPIIAATGGQVGLVTSGAPGLSVNKNIGLGYVPLNLSEIGTRIDIEIRGKAIEAKVCVTPFYKRA